MCKANDSDDSPRFFYSDSEEEDEEEEEEEEEEESDVYLLNSESSSEEEESDDDIVSELKPGDQLNPLTLHKSLEKFEESLRHATNYVKDTEGLGRSCFDLLEYVESIYDCFHEIDKRWKKVGDSKGFSLRPSTLDELTFDQLQSFVLDLLNNEAALYYDALVDFLEPFPLSAAREKQLEKLRLAINYYGLQLGPASYYTSSEPDYESDDEDDDDEDDDEDDDDEDDDEDDA